MELGAAGVRGLSSRPMRRLQVLAACLVASAAGTATARGPGQGNTQATRTSKVTIETDPPGAKVYFNVKEDGEICTTPCTVDAPVGETPIIVEAENRRSIIENLVVPRKTAVAKGTKTLKVIGTTTRLQIDSDTLKLICTP